MRMHPLERVHGHLARQMETFQNILCCEQHMLQDDVVCKEALWI